MNAGERARRQRCRMLEIAAVFGLLLTGFSIVGRTWPAVAAGLAGVAVVVAVHRRRCRDLEDEK